jgi:toxin-antitoxin system PIN domain toxin
MRAMINGPEPYAVADFAVLGMVRVVTDRRFYREVASTITDALAFADEIRNQPHARVISPGPKFWSIFSNLCRKTDAGGKLIPDAYLAALALEHGCEFISTDTDLRRFPGLRSRHPLN